MADYNKRFLDGQYRNSKEKNKLINYIIKDFKDLLLETLLNILVMKKKKMY